jgi:hypothetical protein
MFRNRHGFVNQRVFELPQPGRFCLDLGFDPARVASQPTLSADMLQPRQGSIHARHHPISSDAHLRTPPGFSSPFLPDRHPAFRPQRYAAPRLVAGMTPSPDASVGR